MQIICVSGATSLPQARAPRFPWRCSVARTSCARSRTPASPRLKPLVAGARVRRLPRRDSRAGGLGLSQRQRLRGSQSRSARRTGSRPLPRTAASPTLFEPGRWTGVFQTPFGSAGTLAWTLGGQTRDRVERRRRAARPILELRKVTAPAGDPGVFNLLLNGQVLASGGNGTTAGPYTVGVGEGTVSETAGPGTNLADYESTVTCTRNGNQEVSVTGTKVDGAVANGDFVVCTFTNRRITTPPTPLPPDPPQPPRPPTPPGSSTTDTHTAARRTRSTWRSRRRRGRRRPFSARGSPGRSR